MAVSEDFTLEALRKTGIITFHFYPQTRTIVFSDEASAQRDEENGGFNKVCHSVEEMFTEEDALDSNEITRFKRLFRRIEAGEEHITDNIMRKDGRWLKVTLTRITKNEANEPVSCVGIIQDMQENYRQRAIIEALGNASDCIYAIDATDATVSIIRESDEFKHPNGDSWFEGAPYNTMINSYIDHYVWESDREVMREATEYSNILAKTRSLPNNTFTFDYRRKNTSHKAIYFRVKYVLVEDDFHPYIVVSFKDISAEKRSELERISHTDPVTEGLNREGFKKFLAHRKHTGYVVSMDIHGFRNVNAICGLAKGDRVLKKVWELISEQLSDRDAVARITADKFIIYFASLDSAAVELKLQLITYNLRMLSLKLSIPMLDPYFGVTTFSAGKSIDEAYGEANFAKQQVKHVHDINVQFYSQKDADVLARDRELESFFYPAIENKLFEVWYQPKYNPKDNTLVGAEGLVRWRTPSGDLVSPGAFIPLFERDGLIRILDEYVFRTVCEQQKAWLNAGKKVVPISVNLSRQSIRYENVASNYAKIAKEVGIPTSLVPIEITESAYAGNRNIRGLADEFHANGFELLIDDFGSGYSSLSTLNMGCFDVLKLDMSLINHIGDSSGELLLNHTIAIAKGLDLYIVAEGVETENQVQFLKNLECDSIQGYYYSRPLPVDEYSELI